MLFCYLIQNKFIEGESVEVCEEIDNKIMETDPRRISDYTLQTGFEVEEWLAIADIGIISSYYEQCSYTAIEMMMHGLPIIAPDGLGIRNMFIAGINAKVAKTDNGKKANIYRKNLANSIIYLLKSPDLCGNLSKGARKTYNDKYTIREMKANYKKLIESL